MKLITKATSFALLGALSLGASFAQAQATDNAPTAGNAEAGKAKAAVCGACHGADGNSPIAMFPKIAGQGERYTVKQLVDIKTGARDVPQMKAIVDPLSNQDFADIAAYFAAQTPSVGAANKDLVELGQKIYRAGKPEAGVPACAGCHGADGKGMPEAGFPLLSGQHADYTEAQLKAFRAAGRADEAGVKRTNDGDTMMMRTTAARLSDADIKALSSYISGLH